MERQLVLHIGDYKTGSTVLQSMLIRRDCRPRGVRLLFPGNASHAALARSLGKRRAELYPKRWAGLAKRLEQAEWDVAVLSSELFELIAPDAVAEALRDHLPAYADNIRVIAYVRPNAERVVSQFAENLKLGFDTDDFAAFFDRFHAAGRMTYADRLGRWRAAFGDRLTIRPYVRAMFPDGDIRKDFLSQILPGVPYELNEGQDDNRALTVPDLALMRLLQRRFAAIPGIDPDNRGAFGKQFARLLRDQPPTVPADRLRLPRPLYDRLRDICMADAETLDAAWIGAPCFVPALVAAATETVETAQSLDWQAYHSAETARLMTIWADLLARQMNEPRRDFVARLRASD